MLEVAAVILSDEQDRILICKRKEGGNCGNLWEFPGGKREVHETMETCAVRECQEELGVTIEIDGIFDQHTFAYPDREIAFTFFWGHITEGVPQMRVHNGLCWAARTELTQFAFCPADTELVERLAKGAQIEKRRFQ